MVDLSNKKEEYGNGRDGIAIKKYSHGIEGGVALDCKDFPDDYICAGHGVIKEEGVYKPQPVDGSKHAFLVGVVRATTSISRPSVGVMTSGYINNAVLKYPFSADSLGKLKEEGIYNQED